MLAQNIHHNLHGKENKHQYLHSICQDSRPNIIHQIDTFQNNNLNMKSHYKLNNLNHNSDTHYLHYSTHQGNQKYNYSHEGLSYHRNSHIGLKMVLNTQSMKKNNSHIHQLIHHSIDEMDNCFHKINQSK